MSRKARPVNNKSKSSQSFKLAKSNKVKTNWDLKHLYYKNETDPQIEKDITKAEKAYLKFAKKYRNRNFTKSPQSLAIALNDLEKLYQLPESRKPIYYFSYRLDLNSADSTAEKQLQLLSDRLTKVGNELIFFDVTISKIPKSKQKQFLNSKALSKYKYYLEREFMASKHILSEPEEKILSLKSNTSRYAWIAGTEKILNQQTVDHKGKIMPIAEVIEKLPDYPRVERHKVWLKLNQVLNRLAPIAENEINAIVQDKKVNDELRGYKKPYDATLLGYECEEKTFLNLLEVVENNYQISRDYYKLKKSLLPGKPTFIDRHEKLGKLPKYSFQHCVELCKSVFAELDNDYLKIFENMLANGQIDVYPKKGKTGGAFNSSAISQPTMVLLNHVDTFRSLECLAHEIGHAIHSEMSKVQPTFYQGYTLPTAETMSTFFEGLVKEKLLESLEGKQKLVILDYIISEKINAIMGCTARVKFELEFHDTIRSTGAMTSDELTRLFVSHMKQYVGNSFEIKPENGLSYIYISQFRRNFYHFTYAIGELGSSIMRSRLNTDPNFKSKLKTFLQAGGSKTVESIFKEAGIDLTKKSVYEEGLNILKDELSLYKNLVKTHK
jgi:oligoendopeptidase F